MLAGATRAALVAQQLHRVVPDDEHLPEVVQEDHLIEERARQLVSAQRAVLQPIEEVFASLERRGQRLLTLTELPFVEHALELFSLDHSLVAIRLVETH